MLPPPWPLTTTTISTTINPIGLTSSSTSPPSDEGRTAGPSATPSPSSTHRRRWLLLKNVGIVTTLIITIIIAPWITLCHHRTPITALIGLMMSNSCPCSPTTYRCRSRLRLPHQTLPRRLIKIATMMRKLLHRRINNNNKSSSSSSPRMSLEKWKARARITSHHHHKPPRTRRLLPLMVIPSSIQKELRGKTLYIYSHIARLKKKIKNPCSKIPKL